MSPDEREDYFLLRAERAAEQAADRAIDKRLQSLWRPMTFMVPLVVTVLTFAGYTGYSRLDEWISTAVKDKVAAQTKEISELDERVRTIRESVIASEPAIRGMLESARDHTNYTRTSITTDLDERRRQLDAVIERDLQRLRGEARRVKEETERTVTKAEELRARAQEKIEFILSRLSDKLKKLESLRLDALDEMAMVSVALKEVADDPINQNRIKPQAEQLLRRLVQKDLTAEELQPVRSLVRRAAVELRLFELISEQAKHPLAWERAEWILCLGGLADPKAIPGLFEIISAKGPADAREAGVRGLAETVADLRPAAVVPLPEKLFDDDVRCRPRLAQRTRRPRLTIDQAEGVLQTVAALLQEPGGPSRGVVLRSLGWMWAPGIKSEGALLDIVEQALKSDNSAEDRLVGLWVYAATRSRLGTERLKRVVLDGMEDIHTREAAAETLRRSWSLLPDAAGTLRELSQNPDVVVRKIAEAEYKKLPIRGVVGTP